MHQKKFFQGLLLIVGCLLFVFLTSCKDDPTPTPPVLPTIDNSVTLPPTETAVPPTATPIPTSTPIPTATPTPEPTITPNIPTRNDSGVNAQPPPGGFVAPEVEVAWIAFANLSEFVWRVSILGLTETFTLDPGQIVERQLPPGTYTYTATNLTDQQLTYTEEVELPDLTRIEIQLFVPESTLAFENQTEESLTISLPTIGIDFLIPAKTTSEAQEIATGSYEFNVFLTGVNDILWTDKVDIELGVAITVPISSAQIYAGLVIQNLTEFDLTLSLEGTDHEIAVPAFSSSSEVMVLPGEYVYTAVASSNTVAPFTGTIMLDSGFTTTLVLDFGDERADVLIKNKTDCTLNVKFNGPDALETTIPPAGQQLVNLTNGMYQYTITTPDCNVAPYNNQEEFIGPSELSFSFE